MEDLAANKTQMDAKTDQESVDHGKRFAFICGNEWSSCFRFGDGKFL